MQKSKIFYDEKSDVLYFFIKEGLEEEHREIAPGISVELDNRGNVLGLEIINASRVITSVIPPLLSLSNKLSNLNPKFT